MESNLSLREKILLDKLKADLKIETAKLIGLQKNDLSDEASVRFKEILLAQGRSAVDLILKLIHNIENPEK